MEKLDVMKELFDLIGLPLVQETKWDDLLAADAERMERDNSPLFQELVKGDYKYLVADDGGAGFYALRTFCDFGGWSGYKAKETELLVSLVLGRQLTVQEKTAAEESTDICNYMLYNDEGYVRYLIEDTYADDEWTDDCMIPVRLALFFLYATEDELLLFWTKFDTIISPVRKVVETAQKHYSRYWMEL